MSAILDQISMTQWLLNNNLMDQSFKNNIFFYGTIAHPAVQAVNCDVIIKEKTIKYTLYFNHSMLQLIHKFKKLSQSTSLFSRWRYKRMLKKTGNLHLHKILEQCIKDYCGANWRVLVNYDDIRNFKVVENENESG